MFILLVPGSGSMLLSRKKSQLRSRGVLRSCLLVSHRHQAGHYGDRMLDWIGNWPDLVAGSSYVIKHHCRMMKLSLPIL